MRKVDAKRKSPARGLSPKKLLTPFHRALKMTGAELNLTSDSQASLKDLLATSLTYTELRKMNEHLLKLERQKAEAIELFRRRYRCF